MTSQKTSGHRREDHELVRFPAGRFPPSSIAWIIVICVLIELLLLASDHGLLGNQAYRNFAYGYGAFWLKYLYGADPAFEGQTATMFVTYSFLHGGWLHLVVNMMALYSIGKAIVRRVGERRFLIAYSVSVIGGAVGFASLSHSAAPMVGASGALFGLLGVWICWDYMDRKHYGDSIRATYKALAFLLVYNLVFWLLLSGRLAWETHLGGFLSGWALALYWGRNVYLKERRKRVSSPHSKTGDTP